MSKLWGGRFKKDTSQLMLDFHSSIHFDQKLYHWDIIGSIAHANMLAKQGIISADERQSIVNGLHEILSEIESGKVEFTTDDEDIHMNIERLLIAKIGEAGKKLHTARSRNDQVALDLRLYLRHEVQVTIKALLDLIQVLLDSATQNIDAIMPGYTHLQRAQPIYFSHHLLAYVEMFSRDVKFLENWLDMHNVMPLGSGALAGTTFNLDRNFTANELGFESPCLNSLDGVSDRDFALDYLYIASRSMMHLSRLCEEIVFWSSQEFNFITLDDAYSTGSSIMPQKKNPDVAELVRGKSGRAYGNLMSLLTTMKGLPLAYNKDMQEDKEAVFDSVETWQKCLLIFAPMMATLKVNRANMEAATKKGFTNATDLADYLAKKGIPFRDAHRIVGEMVATALDRGIVLEDMSLKEMQDICPLINEDIFNAIDVHTCANERKSFGGTSLENVRVALMSHAMSLKSLKDKYIGKYYEK